MATKSVIDSLIVELALDPSKFTRGQREALDQLRKFEDQSVRSGNEIERRGKRMTELLGSFRREFLSTLGVFLGGRSAKEALNYMTSLDAATGRLAHSMAMNVTELSAWQGAIKQAGGNAEGASAALSGLSSEVSRFLLTGQTSMLPVLSRLNISLYDQNRNLKTASQLWLDIAGAVEGMDPRQATAFLQMIPGANESMIQFALRGREAMQAYIEAARQAGTTTQQSAEIAENYVRVTNSLSTAADNLLRVLTVLIGPAVTSVLDKLGKLFQGWATSPDSAAGKEIDETSRHKAMKRFGSPRQFMKNWFGWLFTDKDLDSIYGPPGADEAEAGKAALKSQMRARAAAAALPSPGLAGATGKGYSVPIAQVEQMIMEEARKRGIDPNVALSVARSEGMYSYKSTVPGEESYGPYQLYFGSRGGGGLGPEFTRRTGIDPRTQRDEGSIRAQIQFSLDKAAQGGWGPWHGWKGLPRAGLPSAPQPGLGMGGAIGAGSAGATTTVNVNEININAPNAKDSKDIAATIVPSLRERMMVGGADRGQR